LSQLKKQKLEAAGSSGAVQALRMENGVPVVGRMCPPVIPRWPDLGIETRWSRPTSGWPVIQEQFGNNHSNQTDA
jgi:hypothetical protein